MNQLTSKACTKCREVKPLEAFGAAVGARKQAQCRNCMRKPRKMRALEQTETHKECRRCGVMTPRGNFGVSKKSQDGRTNFCYACNADWSRAWRAAQPKPPRAERAVKTPYRLRHPEVYRLAESRRRARLADSRLTDFTVHQALQRALMFGNRCWMCGAKDWKHWDHVKPLSKGGAHCLSNLRPACGSCNQSKSSKWHGSQWAHGLRFR